MKQLFRYIKDSVVDENHPKNEKELKKIIIERIKKDGPECDLNDIDVSKITDMTSLFDTTGNEIFKIFEDFNGDISKWDVSHVTSMHAMFYGCRKFNCDLSHWNVSNVEDMTIMFYDCQNFNSDISQWDVSNVKTMYRTFYNCKKFNQDLDSWDVSNIEYKAHAFDRCPTQPKWHKKK